MKVQKSYCAKEKLKACYSLHTKGRNSDVWEFVASGVRPIAIGKGAELVLQARQTRHGQITIRVQHLNDLQHPRKTFPKFVVLGDGNALRHRGQLFERDAADVDVANAKQAGDEHVLGDILKSGLIRPVR